MLRRLDAELVHRKLARSRDHARELIEAGVVQVAGLVAHKPATQVRPDASIRVEAEETERYVSRGAHKLIGALDRFSAGGLNVAGRLAMDAGASTGGFTQVLLERGASEVLAVDVGYGVLAWPLRNDERVHVYERMNIRNVQPSDLAFRPSLVVADLSFISLRTVLPALSSIAAEDADLVLMVKPQFEVGKEAVGNGVVRDPQLRVSAVAGVAHVMQELGFGIRDVVASPLPGPSGNVEYFVWGTRGVEWCPQLDAMIAKAVSEGPQ
jgi:23S rRNA (cytidine1920-2'-O)/16S rRNA (cytidine1409-2'-O)-methyltransferase